MASLSLAYGAGSVDVDVAWADVQAILTAPSPPAADPVALLHHACLDAPIGHAGLAAALTPPPERATIVVSDCTRPSGSAVVVPWLLDQLNAHGVPDAAVTVVFALGIHRPQTEAEQARLLGPAAGRVRAVDHDAHDAAQLVHVGTTTRGNAVRVNRLVVDTDCCILTGAITPHYFAGFGGGRKAIMPGVSGEAACLFSHQLIFRPGVGAGRDPRAVAGVLDGNPVHEDMCEAAAMASPAFLVNTVLDPDGAIVAVFAGDVDTAHRAGCAYYADTFGIAVGEPAELVIVSAGGAPKDCNLIQAHKAMHTAFPAVQPGGVMLVFAECADGPGHERFLEWFAYDDVASHEAALRAHYHTYGQTALALREKAAACTIVLVSALPDAVVRRCGVVPASTVEEGVARARAACSARPRTLVLPTASSIVLRPRETSTASP